MKRSTPDDVDDDGRYGAGKKIDLSGQRGDGSVVDWILREALLQQGQEGEQSLPGGHGPPTGTGDISTRSAIIDGIEALSLSGCGMGPANTSLLLSSLSSPSSPALSNLKWLNLRRNGIGASGGSAVGTYLSTDTPLKFLDISLNDIKASQSTSASASVAKGVADGLCLNTTLEHLLMEQCALGPDGAAALSTALVSSNRRTSLRRLELAGNMLGPGAGTYDLFEALRSNSVLTRLGLRMNRIGGGGGSAVRVLSEAMGGGTCRLCSIDLSYNELRCRGLITLSEALAVPSCTVRELILEKNDIKGEGIVALTDALDQNPRSSLATLSLKGNDIGNGGTIALGMMLGRNATLETLDVSSCCIENEGGAALGRGLEENKSLKHLYLENNYLGRGGIDNSLITLGLSRNASLQILHLSKAELGGDGGALESFISNALSTNTSLVSIDLSDNSLSDGRIIDAVAAHPTLKNANLSDNKFTNVRIDTQLLLSTRINGVLGDNIDGDVDTDNGSVGHSSSDRTPLTINLCFNPLSSPPLGRLATESNLRNYLLLLQNERTAVTRIRLMVLGYGGVGKSTFCRAMTSCNDEEARNFQNTLIPLERWDNDMLANWAHQLGASWASEAMRMVQKERIMGTELHELIVRSADQCQPSEHLRNVCGSQYPSIDSEVFAKAISSLITKGYLSTVGAVKVEGTIELSSGGNQRTCSMVDFAGQVEFLVSHQLLLSSMHTLCMIIQPSPAFAKAAHRHAGSWNYWSRFLRALGDRRAGSLLLAVSHLDKLVSASNNDNLDRLILHEFNSVRQNVPVGVVSGDHPVKLDYRPNEILMTISEVKTALSQAASAVARDWWVPASYERLSDLVQIVGARKAERQELPIVTIEELTNELDAHCKQSSSDSNLLAKILNDPQLMKRGIDYLEAVGDVMTDDRLGFCLLLDPVDWFAKFLAYFIKDDDAVSSVQIDSTSIRRKRGTIHLDEVIRALQHEYANPHEYVPQVMSLLCRLELCIPLGGAEIEDCPLPSDSSFLFPCLLPNLPASDLLLEHWPIHAGDGSPPTESSFATLSFRGHRFREITGFVPPGLFVGLLARLMKHLEPDAMHPSRMWRDHAVLVFGNGRCRALLRCDVNSATIDVVAAAQTPEGIFVGAAKGQASVVVWMVHYIHMFLRSYSQLRFEEFWLCPSPSCHVSNDGLRKAAASSDLLTYRGSEFPLVSADPSRRSGHDCNVEGCWRYLGTGHKLESLVPSADCLDLCRHCHRKPVFALRKH